MQFAIRGLPAEERILLFALSINSLIIGLCQQTRSDNTPQTISDVRLQGPLINEGLAGPSVLLIRATARQMQRMSLSLITHNPTSIVHISNNLFAPKYYCFVRVLQL